MFNIVIGNGVSLNTGHSLSINKSSMTEESNYVEKNKKKTLYVVGF
jgi:hypothetical protein